MNNEVKPGFWKKFVQGATQGLAQMAHCECPHVTPDGVPPAGETAQSFTDKLSAENKAAATKPAVRE